jgi:TatD DNase family protein
MNYIDTHTHLYFEEFDNDRDAIIEKSISQGVRHMILPNVDVQTLEPLRLLCEKYQENMHAAYGLHPTSVKENYQNELAEIKLHLQSHTCIAIGEIGIDMYWDKTFFNQQKEALEMQLQWAKDLNMPVILHCRDSFNEVYNIVQRMMPLRGVFHAFSTSFEDAQKVIDLGFYIGIGGVVTFKNGGLDKVVSQLNLNNLVLETDAPYLTPTPHRGKRNEPAYLSLISQKIAEVMQVSVEEVSAITTQNAKQLFGLS